MGAHKSPRAVSMYAVKGDKDRPFRLEIQVEYTGIDDQEKKGKVVGVMMPMRVYGVGSGK